MAKPTKADRIAAGKKAAATRSKNEAKRSAQAKKGAATRATKEAKESGNDLKRAAAGAAKAGVGVGRVAIGTAGRVAEAVAKRVGAVKRHR